MMCSEKFLKVESGGLFQELRLTSMCGIIAEGYQTSPRKVYYLAVQFEDSGSSLNLRFEPMRGRAKPI